MDKTNDNSEALLREAREIAAAWWRAGDDAHKRVADRIIAGEVDNMHCVQCVLVALTRPSSPAATDGDAVERRTKFGWTITVHVPSDVAVGDDRLAWYFDHAIRGYHRHVNDSATDPIHQLRRCSVSVKKGIPLPPSPVSDGGAVREVDAQDTEINDAGR